MILMRKFKGIILRHRAICDQQNITCGFGGDMENGEPDGGESSASCPVF